MTASQKRVNKAACAVRRFVALVSENADTLLDDPRPTFEDMTEDLRDMLGDVSDMMKCDLHQFRWIFEKWDEHFYKAVESSMRS